MQFFAMCDNHTVLFLGDFQDEAYGDAFGKASDRAPSNTVWIFDRPGIVQFIRNAQTVAQLTEALK